MFCVANIVGAGRAFMRWNFKGANNVFEIGKSSRNVIFYAVWDVSESVEAQGSSIILNGLSPGQGQNPAVEEFKPGKIEYKLKKMPHITTKKMQAMECRQIHEGTGK